jgi:hypothetical protein
MTHFARISRLSMVALAVLTPAAGRAQVADGSLVTTLRECRAMADVRARTACYDSVPLDQPEQQAAVATPAARAEQQAGADFGSNQLPRPSSAASAAPDRISARVARAIEREPGIYLLTLADGTEWQFVDGAPADYDPPRRGSTVEISSASMGSYLLRYAGQRSVRTRRVR